MYLGFFGNYDVDVFVRILYFYFYFRCRIVFIFVFYILVFFEYLFFLILFSDIRFRGDGVSILCGVIEGIEFICLLFFVMDVIIKVRFEILLKVFILKSYI